jgi:hypothetical protein
MEPSKIGLGCCCALHICLRWVFGEKSGREKKKIFPNKVLKQSWMTNGNDVIINRQFKNICLMGIVLEEWQKFIGAKNLNINVAPRNMSWRMFQSEVCAICFLTNLCGPQG